MALGSTFRANCVYTVIIIIIKLYLYTDKSGTAAPFTGVYTHYDKNNTLIIKVVKEKIYCEK